MLSAIAITAKRHWRYPARWIRQWLGILTITPSYIAGHPTYVATSAGKALGFCALCLNRGVASIDHLWVLPEAMNRGIGRALFRRATKMAREAGAIRIRIESDPHAVGFYHRLGARTVGRHYAPVDGHERWLPVLEKDLRARAAGSPRPSN